MKKKKDLESRQDFTIYCLTIVDKLGTHKFASVNFICKWDNDNFKAI